MRRTQAAFPGLTPSIGAHIAALAFMLVPVLVPCAAARAQVITVDSKTGEVSNSNAQSSDRELGIDRRYAQIEPTHVELSTADLDPKTKLALIRALISEQGFAMRPFPHGHKGLTLEANGKLEPAGEAYQSMAIAEGIAAKPGERVLLTNVKVEHNRLLIDLNYGPEGKRGFMRHISIGGTGGMTPLAVDGADEPTGARLTLAFKGHIPELTSEQVEALLAPLISFGVKTPLEAFTDTLPGKLKDAILNHQVLVGMSTEMLIYAVGEPETKYHEIAGNMPFDEWIYGKSPADVQFVRINGNRVIRLEIAKVGRTPQVFTKDEVEGMMRTDGSPLIPPRGPAEAVIREGDTAEGAAVPPPTLSKKGEDIPSSKDTLKPVLFPGKDPDLQPGANPDSVPDEQPAPASHPQNQQPPANEYETASAVPALI